MKNRGRYVVIHGNEVRVDDVIECEGGTLHLLGVNVHARAIYEGQVKNAWVRAVYTIWPETRDLDVFIGNSKEELDYEGYIDPDTGVEGRFDVEEISDYVAHGIEWANRRGYLRRRT